MESDLQFMDSQLSTEAPAADAVVDPVDTAVADETAPLEGEAEVTDGEKVEGEAEVTTEAKDGEAKETEEDEFYEDLSVGSFNKKLEGNPALKAELEKDPATRNLVFSALRRNAKLDQYETLFTNPETAKFNLDTANEMIEFDRMYRSEEPTDNEGFLRALQYNSFVRDEQGNIQTNADGTPQSSGAYERTMATYRSFMWNDIDAMAKQAGDEELAEAVRIIREKVEGTTAPATREAKTAAQSDDLPADVKARLSKLDEYEKRDKETSKQSSTTFTTSVKDEVKTKLSEAVSNLVLSATKKNSLAISEYERKNIIRDSIEIVEKNLGANMAYQNMFRTLMQTTGRTPEGKAKLVNYAMSSIKQALPRIVATTISTATKKTVAAQNTKNEKITNQINRRETQTSGGVGRSQPLPDIKSVIEAAAKSKGKPLTEYEMAELAMSMK